MTIIPKFINNTFGNAAALVYTIYPFRFIKGTRLRCQAEDDFKQDIARATRKVLIVCQSFGFAEHPDIDVSWFNKTIDALNGAGVSIELVSDRNPPEFVQTLIDSGKITLKKSNCLPFVGHLVDNKIIDICFHNKDGAAPGGSHWRTEYARPDLQEFIEDMLRATIPFEP